MNQHIQIFYKPERHLNPNYWDICFGLNRKIHREKAPSSLYSDGTWSWFVHDEWENEGYNFNWKNISRFRLE